MAHDGQKKREELFSLIAPHHFNLPTDSTPLVLIQLHAHKHSLIVENARSASAARIRRSWRTLRPRPVHYCEPLAFAAFENAESKAAEYINLMIVITEFMNGP